MPRSPRFSRITPIAPIYTALFNVNDADGHYGLPIVALEGSEPLVIDDQGRLVSVHAYDLGVLALVLPVGEVDSWSAHGERADQQDVQLPAGVSTPLLPTGGTR